MSRLAELAANLAQYFGLHSENYFHSEAPANYDPDDLLAYYLDHRNRADFDGPRESAGLPQYSTGDRTDYLPVQLALYAVGHAERYRRTNEDTHRRELLKVADWFVENQDDDGVWLSPFPLKQFGLTRPYPSAMSQGMAISVLLRAYTVVGNARYLESARAALAPFHRTVGDGGVKTVTDGRVFYEEFPGQPTRHVLNGFLYAMWGLFDLVRVDGNEEARQLWNDGIDTIIRWLPKFDTGYWSRYHIGAGPENPATIPYHKLHIEQLTAMYRITQHPIFRDHAERWQTYLESRGNALRTLPTKIWWKARTSL